MKEAYGWHMDGVFPSFDSLASMKVHMARVDGKGGSFFLLFFLGAPSLPHSQGRSRWEGVEWITMEAESGYEREHEKSR